MKIWMLVGVLWFPEQSAAFGQTPTMFFERAACEGVLATAEEVMVPHSPEWATQQCVEVTIPTEDPAAVRLFAPMPSGASQEYRRKPAAEPQGTAI